MSIGKIGSKTDILQDPAVTGANYTGVGNMLALGGGQPCKYGFILASNSQVAADLVVGTQQVVLSLNPQAISQDEPAATNITYTQNAGKYIERRGQVSKTITLQGTTGYTPTPKVPAALRSSLPQPLIIQQEGPVSGLAQFIQLRNLLRRYWQIFSDDAFIPLRQKTLLIFINGKDDESWVVEPMAFRMDRASPANKFTYQYSITLQTIAPVEALVFDPDILTDYQKVGNALSQVAQAYNTITAAAAVIGTALSTLAGAARDALQAVSAVAQIGAQALDGLVNGTKQVIGVGKVFTGQVDDIKNSYMGAWNNLLGIADYTRALYGVDPMPFAVHQAMASIALTMADLSSRKELFAMDFPQTWQQTLQNYTPSYGFGGYNQDLVAPLQKGAVQETTILPGDSLQNIAVRELGNAERVMELVVLNQLKPPFISPSQTDRAPNTLAPGDTLLIPAQSPAESGPRALVRTSVFSDPNLTSLVTAVVSTSQIAIDTRGRNFRINQWAGFTVDVVGLGVSRIVVSNDASSLTLDAPLPGSPALGSMVRLHLVRFASDVVVPKSSAEQLLGVDLQLVGGDLQVDVAGRLALIDGTDNLDQAVSIKLQARPGDLAAHPNFGLNFDPGTRVSSNLVFTYRVAVRQTLLSDARIDSIAEMDVVVQRDTLQLTGYVVLIGSSQPYSLDTRGTS